MLWIEYCHLQVRGKTDKKINKVQWPHISSRGPETHSFSVQFQVIFSSCFNFSSQLYDIYLVNIYLNILKYITNIYVCQRLEFVVVFWCLLNCLLFQIMLHKFCRNLSSLCVCYVYPFTLLCIYFLCILFAKIKQMSWTPRSRACVSASVNKLVPCCICAPVPVLGDMSGDPWRSFICEWKFSQLCQICWFYKPFLQNALYCSHTRVCVCVCVYARTHEIECSFQFAFVL